MSSTAPDNVRLLLVEDSPSDAALIKAWLTAQRRFYQFTVKLVESLEEAQSALRASSFDVILLDLGLTDSVGLSTLRSMEGSHTPIIVLTGLDDDTVVMDAVRNGAQDYLLKNAFNEKSLLRSIRYTIERHRLENERRELSRNLLSVLEDEQQRIARELHDEVGQILSGLNMTSRSLTRRLRELGLDESKRASVISEGLQDALDSFRHVLCGLSPVDVDEQGLVVALQRLCDQTQRQSDRIECTFACDEGLSVADNTIATNLYRIGQESLSNARKHANANSIRIELMRHDDLLTLKVIDDGIGFERQQKHDRRMGLRILKHRSELIGGKLSIDTGSTGTTIQCDVPMEQS